MGGKRSFVQLLGLRPAADGLREAPEPVVALSEGLGRFVQAVSSASDEQDPVYQSAVANLQGDADALAAEVSRLVFVVAQDQFALLRCAVMALGAVESPQVVRVLADIATAQHVFLSDADPEASTHAVTVNSSAVEALERLAGAGVVGAADALVDVVRRDVSLTVRALALVALREVGTDGQFEQASSFIPPAQEHLLEFRRVAAFDVPQVSDPRRHLLGDEGPAMLRPDVAGGEQDGFAASDTPRARASNRTETDNDG